MTPIQAPNTFTVLPILHAPQRIMPKIERLANCLPMIKSMVLAMDAGFDQAEVSS